jgi:hypothetical protein
MNGIGLSKEFLEKYLPPFKDGVIYTFQVWPKPRKNPSGDGILIPARKDVPSQYKIYDTETGETVTNQLIKAILPSGPNSNKSEEILLEKLEFTKDHLEGRIICKGGDQKDYEKFVFLYFHSRNRSNMGWPYHLAPDGKYLFHYIDLEKKAEHSLSETKQRISAEKMVVDMSFLELKELSQSVKAARHPGFEYLEYYGENQVRDNLMRVARSHPKVILQFNDELNMDFRVLIQSALDQGYIIENKALKQVNWHDGTLIVYMGQYNSVKDRLVAHFTQDSTKAEDDKERMIGMLSGEVEVSVPEAVEVSGEISFEEAKQKYIEVFGQEPHHLIKKAETLMEKIKEKEASVVS